MTTSPQDDLTAERAAAIRLYENIFAMSPDTEAMEAGDDCQYEAIARALRTARQEALREGMELAAEEADMHVCDDPRYCHCSSKIYKAILDRLTREGVK